MRAGCEATVRAVNAAGRPGFVHGVDRPALSSAVTFAGMSSATSSCRWPSASSTRCWPPIPRWRPAAGDHRYDDRLPDLSADGVAGPGRDAARRGRRAVRCGPRRLDADERVDHEQLLVAWSSGRCSQLTEVREHEWNPLAHNPGDAAARAGRPAVRARGRAAGVARRPAGRRARRAGHRPRDPAGLPADPPGDGGRPVPRHGGAGPRRGAGAAARRRPAWRRTVEPAATAAGAALDVVRRLAARAGRPTAGAGPRPAPGPAAVGGQALAHARHRADRRRGAATGPRTTSTRVTEEIRAAAAELVGGRADDDTVRRGARPARRRAPGQRHDRRPGQADAGRDDRVRPRRTTWSPWSTIRCVIQEMPEFARGVAVAYCDSPGPLETADVPTFYCIAPTPADWPRRAGRVVLPRVQRPHDPQPDRARGDAGPLPAARPRPPLSAARPGSGRSPGPARSSRAGPSTPRR